MKKIAFFSIPAHGHTNPMLPVASELVSRGDKVRFYSFDEFAEKIKATGAEFISCNAYLSKLSKEQEAKLKKVSTTTMAIEDIRITLSMNEFLDKEFNSFKPDVVYTDAVCFWGKLNAWKFNVPLVVSTSTFAFNQLSTKYMKNSPAEMADMILGLPLIGKELKTLEPYGYNVKNPLNLVQNDNNTDSIVYTSRKLQPYVESYSDHYLFVGPSVFSKTAPNKNKSRPLVYISMGTVLNENVPFYKSCIEALKDMDADVIISCGKNTSIESLGEIPDNIKVYPYVDQLDILSRSDVFLTHCGMNSASEGLYMATPMVLFPQTGEQRAVARRISELGAGAYLKSDSPQDIRKAIQTILDNSSYAKAAKECSDDFRSCPGVPAAADFIENAPHTSNGVDLLTEINKKSSLLRLIYWLVVIAIAVLFAVFVTSKYTWLIATIAGVAFTPIGNAYQEYLYKKMAKERT